MTKRKNSSLKKIGLLGGSFNPAHAGHLHISEIAYKHFGLDEVWWLVAKQNPHKSTDDMASFEERFESAIKIASKKDEIIISDFEQKNNTQYSHDTLKSLIKQNSNAKFLWIMGADNLVSFHKWHKWQEIAAMVDIAVMDRAELADCALNSDAAKIMKNSFLPENDCADIMDKENCRWCFLHIEKHPASSTKIRENG